MSDDLSFKIVIVDDEGKTTPVPLTREEYSIGRQEGNVIRLTERNISRRHARLFRAKGHWVIEDLGSYNGVFVNSDRIKERAVISNGDTIQVGDYRLIFREFSETETEESVYIDSEIPSLPPPRLTTAVEGEQPKLIVINGPEPGSIVNLEDGDTVIGRGDSCDIQVDDVSVSREHARIELTAQYCKIEDTESANGVRINGMPRSEHYLQHGDTIELGNILLRYVAAGAWDPLLEQLQMQQAMAGGTGSRKALIIGLPVAILGLLAVVGLAVFFITFSRNPETRHAGGITEEELKTMSIDELIQSTQESYDAQKWEETITYAAEVLKYEPSNQRVKDMKTKATYELDQQPHYEEGLKAYKRKEWEKAYRTFSKIGLESVYRSRPEVPKAADKFIEQLMNELEDAYEAKDWDAVEEKAMILESLPELDEEDLDKVKRISRMARSESGRKSGGGGASKKSDGGGTSKSGGTEPVVSAKSTQDALKEARKAILANDQKKCIAILQKTKATPTVLDLLATCYKGAKQMDRYYATLKRYVSKYPTGPKAEKYRKILKDAGQL